jgi:hypothetical protein
MQAKTCFLSHLAKDFSGLGLDVDSDVHIKVTPFIPRMGGLLYKRVGN